ncbi:Fph type histidine kinase [Chiua virens]|nr:Fph type histidine kinase [Chiua virens]
MSVQPDGSNVDLSSTYHAGSSSDDSESDTAGEDTDDEQHLNRGRRLSSKSLRQDVRDTLRRKKQQSSPFRRALSPVFMEHVVEQRINGATGRKQSFTRSRSPHVRTANSSGQSPNQGAATSMSHARHRVLPTSCALLGEISLHIPIPFSGIIWTFYVDSRRLAESLLLLGSLFYANRKLASAFASLHTLPPTVSSEIRILIVTCIIYIIWSHSYFVKKAPTPPPSDVDDVRAPSPRIESRESKRGGGRSSSSRTHFGFVWMSVPKNFRDCSDDGAMTGLSFAPLIAIALLYSSLLQAASPTPALLPPGWLIDASGVLDAPLSTLNNLMLSRRCLVDYATLCSFILLVQIFSSSWYEARYRRARNVPEGERGSVPRSEVRRTWTYWIYSYVLTAVALLVRYLLASISIGLWQNLSYFDIIVGSVFFQFCLYVALRLAHGGFTLGELALVCFGGLSLGTELLNLTRALLWPKRTPFIKTYRLPTPLLIFQIALIAGSLLTGFLLSPLLALSRHIAQRPVRRLRFPDEKPRHRRALAAAFYIGSVVIVTGLIGSWTWLSLGKRDPWLWAIFWVYWALLGSISVAGWNRQLSRSRRYKTRNATSNLGDNGTLSTPPIQTQKSTEPVPPAGSATAGLGLAFANLPNLPNLPNGTQVATDLLDAADKHVPTLSHNARRKFFHGLAVVMFLPGVAIDPAFAHLSFSAAFAFFIFAEYVRTGDGDFEPFLPTDWMCGLSVAGRAVADSDVYGHPRSGRWGCTGVDCGEANWEAPVVNEFVEDDRGEHCICGVCDRMCMGSAFDADGLDLDGTNDNLTLPLYMWSMLVVAEVILAATVSPVSSTDFLVLCHARQLNHVIMSIPDNDRSSKLAVPALATPFPLLQDPSFQMPFQLFQNPSERARRPSRPATASILDSVTPFVLTGPPSDHQPTPPPRADCDASDHVSRSDAMSDGSLHTTDSRSQATSSDYDWASFMTAYAAGQWSPHRTPHPPRSVFEPAWPTMPLAPSDGPTFTSSNKCSAPPSESPVFGVFLSSTMDPVAEKDPKNPLTVSPEKQIAKLPPPPASLIGRRFRKSFNDLRQTTGHTMQLSLDGAQGLTMAPDATTAAATMRWAAARVNISPLALPSPEHELTDPMRGVHAAIPGVHAPEGTTSLNPTTPGNNLVPPSVPLSRQSPEEHPEEDYFTAASSSRANTMETEARTTPDVPSVWQEYVNVQRDKEPLDINAASTPALPRRICLTRQTSSPLPISNTSERKLAGVRSVSETISSYRMGRAAKEEQMFLELGYLAPPNPPDELERRRALYKFNIWNTAPDINFDRIAHLVKLVFNTKSVYISLVDGTEQWFKSQCGTSFTRCPRLTSFCAHTILQRCDEPTVVLDTLADWRFAKNPFATGSPHTRFYAGAPLRTQEGYNIGSLALIDDSPRQDFSPRQRHTLKEFAAVVMREMELWRDKIQLRIRDKIQTSMEHFSRECLEIDQQESKNADMYASASMDKVYDRAAKLVKRTLDVEEVLVMDVSHCEVLETLSAEATVSVVMHHGNAQRATSRILTAEEQSKLNAFFEEFPDGKISEGILPVCFRPFIPTHIQYALTVPVFNIDKRPFALICAYNASDPSRRFLEGHELSYLRAIGVIILSAVLKRRMMLADQAKSLFISNISHELRTPLHGILAAAELLADTSLNHSQTSFLHTVQACGTSLVETVNHVLDFTKLSGNMKSGGVDNVITRTRVDLEQLVEEAIDGSWIGYCARNSSKGSEIGSVYAPNMNQRASSVMTAPESSQSVEIVVDIDHREGGWTLKCDKGGIRRVLMNLFGNSLKFTSTGYIHVSLKQLSAPEDIVNHTIKIEICVSDTGKGISQNFLKNHLFHPFSQENPLQAGTGLGLAIVSSIVRSSSVAGKVEVVSEENVGTDIKVVFEAEILQENLSNMQDPFFFDDNIRPPVVSFLGFKKRGRGAQLLNEVLRRYLITWWGFIPQRAGAELGEIVILNEDPSPIVTALEKLDTHRSFIILSSSRGSPRIMGICNAYENNGGICRIVHKPGGPFRLRTALKQILRARQRRQHRIPNFTSPVMNPEDNISLQSTIFADDCLGSTIERHRRGSIEQLAGPVDRVIHKHSQHSESDIVFQPTDEAAIAMPSSSHSTSMLGVGASGATLKPSAESTAESTKQNRKVLVVEDNSILRNLLAKWLTKKGFEYREAVDGRQGVEIFQADGPFDVVLLDLSMPILDGVGATVQIRQIERTRSSRQSSVILALTGMSSLEDKRKAFEAGMDGYLVKPVAFRTLDDMFHKLGLA